MRMRIKKKPPKLNLIPILDAVFIFIFFLLMSAQFVEIYEIGSEAPTMKEVTKEQKEDPLNLTIDIHKEYLEVLRGTERKLVKKIPFKNKKKETHESLQKVLIQIKKKNENEKTIILRPSKRIAYKKIVHIMDAARTYKDKKEKHELFSQITFEQP